MEAQGHVTSAGGVGWNWPRNTRGPQASRRSGQMDSGGFLGHWRGVPGGQSGFLRAGWLQWPRASGWRHGQDWLPVPWASPPGCSRWRPWSPLDLSFDTLSHVGQVECQLGTRVLRPQALCSCRRSPHAMALSGQGGRQRQRWGPSSGTCLLGDPGQKATPLWAGHVSLSDAQTTNRQ